MQHFNLTPQMHAVILAFHVLASRAPHLTDLQNTLLT